jgi:hypothetical protein
MNRVEEAGTLRASAESSRMTSELEEELSRVGLQDDLFAIVQKDGPSAITNFGAPVMLLPMSLIHQMTDRDGLDAELMASGLKTSIEILRPHGHTALLAESLLSLARTLRSYGHLEERLQLTLEAIAILQEISARPRLPRAYLDLGSILKDGNLLYDALRAFELASGSSDVGQNDGLHSACHYHKAVICRRLGLETEALAELKRAQEAIPKANVSLDHWIQQIASERLFNNLALGRDEEALEDIAKWIASQGKAAPSGDARWSPYFHRAQIREHSGDAEGAMEDYWIAAVRGSEQVLDYESDRFRRSERTRLNFVFENSLRVALATNRMELAFGLLELSVTGGLPFDAIEEPEMSEVNQKARERLNEELHRLVNAAQRALIERRQEDLIRCQEDADWVLAQDRLLSHSIRTGPVDREQLEGLAAKIRSKLPSGSALIEFASVPRASRGHLLVGEEIWVFCLTCDALQARNTNMTADMVNILTEGFAQECQGIFPVDALDALSRGLLDPLADILDNVTSLFIVPSVGLYGLPFHAMRLNGASLIEGHSVTYLSRAGTFLESPDLLAPGAISSSSRWIGLGAPRVDYAELAELQEVQNELSNIARKFDSSICVLAPPATSRDLLQIQGSGGVLHVACHGDFNPGTPLLARLMLADRPVFAFEIMLAQLNVDLVVLSACQTAEVQAGLGGHVQSLASAFLAAGAKAVVASLWPLDDAAGAKCIERLYDALMNRCDSIADSLRAAQHSIQSERDDLHLYFWAPFALFSTNAGGTSQ